ncbi:MAG: hypothetical protein U0521_01400 [Anaerolineae bacterium]
MLRLCVDIMRGYYDFLVLNTVAWKSNRILQQVLISLLPPFRRPLSDRHLHHVSDEYASRTLWCARSRGAPLPAALLRTRADPVARQPPVYLLSQTNLRNLQADLSA